MICSQVCASNIFTSMKDFFDDAMLLWIFWWWMGMRLKPALIFTYSPNPIAVAAMIQRGGRRPCKYLELELLGATPSIIAVGSNNASSPRRADYATLPNNSNINHTSHHINPLSWRHSHSAFLSSPNNNNNPSSPSRRGFQNGMQQFWSTPQPSPVPHHPPPSGGSVVLGVMFPPLYHPLLKKGISSTNNGSGHDISPQDTIKGEPCQAKGRIRLREDLVVRIQGGCIQIHRWRGVICSWNCHLINIQIFASATIHCDGSKCSSGMRFPFSSYIVYPASHHGNPQTSSVMEAKALIERMKIAVHCVWQHGLINLQNSWQLMAMRLHGFQKGQIRRQNGGSILVLLWDLMLVTASFVGCCRHHHHGPNFAKIMSNEQAKSITLHRLLISISHLLFTTCW